MRELQEIEIEYLNAFKPTAPRDSKSLRSTMGDYEFYREYDLIKEKKLKLPAMIRKAILEEYEKAWPLQ